MPARPERRMRIKLTDERRNDLVAGLKAFTAKEFEIELSDFQARQLLAGGASNPLNRGRRPV